MAERVLRCSDRDRSRVKAALWRGLGLRALSLALSLGGCAEEQTADDAEQIGELASNLEALSDANCTDDGYTLDCDAGLVHRNFSFGKYQTHLKVPAGTPPTSGWPTAVMFQGSYHRTAWSATTDQYTSEAYGGRYQVEVIQSLLAGGYAVLAVDAPWGTYYKTNNTCAGGDVGWFYCDEHWAMRDILSDMASGAYGHALDVGRLYATGISAGGFMTSRFQRHYNGETFSSKVTNIKAVAIQSAGWATCHASCAPSYGPGYELGTMPGSGWAGYGDGQHANTPPTLFLQGAGDTIVPNSVSNLYHDKIKMVKGASHVRQVVEQTTNCENGLPDGECGKHQWIAAAPVEIRAWFDAHP